MTTEESGADGYAVEWFKSRLERRDSQMRVASLGMENRSSKRVSSEDAHVSPPKLLNDTAGARS